MLDLAFIRNHPDIVKTALASPRILLPLFEVHQQPGGSVRIPAAVRPYMGGQQYIRLPEKAR